MVTMRLIGQGTFYNVYCDDRDGQRVCRKQLKDAKDVKAMKSEIEIWTLLNSKQHPNILKLLDCKDDSIITEYMSNGSLQLYLKRHTLFGIELDLLLQISIDAAKGLDFMHSQGIIHRDIKPANILLDNKMQAKLGDFNISEMESCISRTRKGTEGYIAYEVYLTSDYGKPSDVFSFGCMLADLCKFYLDTKETKCPKALYDIVELCIQFNPQKRPLMDQVVYHLEEIRRDIKHKN